MPRYSVLFLISRSCRICDRFSPKSLHGCALLSLKQSVQEIAEQAQTQRTQLTDNTCRGIPVREKNSLLFSNRYDRLSLYMGGCLSNWLTCLYEYFRNTASHKLMFINSDPKTLETILNIKGTRSKKSQYSKRQAKL